MANNVVRYEKDSAFPVKAATTITEGQLVALDSSGNLVVAQKTQGAVKQAVGVAIRAAATNDVIGVASVADVEGFSSLTIGGTCYLSTSGGVTQTRPTTANDAIQPVGFALTATRVRFVVTPYFAIAQAAGNSTLG